MHLTTFVSFHPLDLTITQNLDFLENSEFLNFQSQKDAEAAISGVLYRSMFLKILQTSLENTCARVSFLIKLQASRLWHRCFPVKFAEIFRTPFLQNISVKLHLNMVVSFGNSAFFEFFIKEILRTDIPASNKMCDFLCYFLLIDQISLCGCFYFLRHVAISVLQLFVIRFVTS